MPALSNLKWEAFARAVVDGRPASHDYTKTYHVAGNVAEVSASRLLRNAQVTSRVTELQDQLQAKTLVTAEGLTRDLFEIKPQAMAEGKYAAAVGALALIKKMHGLLVDRSEQVVVYRPAPLPTRLLELTESEWRAQLCPPS